MTAAGKQELPSSIQETPEKITIWPPSQKKRDYIIKRIIREFSGPTLTTFHYGRELPTNEAEVIARQIEHEALIAFEASGIESSKAYINFVSDLMAKIVFVAKSKKSSVKK